MTAQIPETLILDGEAVAMTCCPGIPEDHPRIVAGHGRGREHSGPEEAFIVTTACWRGYRGTWEITDGGLYLVGLVGRIRLRGCDPLHASWYTGTLRVPRGEMLHYVHMGFGSVYEEEILIEVEKGCVVGERSVDNRGKQYDLHARALDNLPGGESDASGGLAHRRWKPPGEGRD